MPNPIDPLMEFIARKANDPRAPELQRQVARAIVTEGANPLMDRLAEHGKWIAGGGDGLSPLEAVAIPGRTLIGGMGIVGEGGQEIAKALTGAGAAAQGKVNPFVALMPNARGSQSLNAAQQAFEEGEGNFWDRARAANEAGAHGHEIEYGLLNMMADPTNLLPGPADELMKVVKLGKAKNALMRLLKDVPEVAAAVEGAAKVVPTRPPPHLDPLMWAPNAPPPASIPGVANNPAFVKAMEGAIEEAGRMPSRAEGLLDVPARTLGEVPPRRVIDLNPPPAAAVDPLLSPPAPGTYNDFLKLARDVRGELPSPGATFWQRLNADPATVGDYFARGVQDNLLGTTHAGTYAVKPGAFARYVPPTTRDIIDAWVGATYDKGAFKAWPNLLKKLGAELTTDGILRGDQNITDNVLSYLMDHSELGNNRKAVGARYQQLLDEITPAVDEAVDDYVPTAEDLANGWGSEISLPFDQQPPPGRSLLPPGSTIEQAVKVNEQRLSHAKGIVQYIRRAGGPDDPALPGALQEVANWEANVKRIRQEAKAAGGKLAPAVDEAVPNADIPAAVARGAAAKSELFDDAADVAQAVTPELNSLVAKQIATPEQLRAMRGTPDEAIRTLNDENKARFAARLAAAKAGVPLDQLPSVTPPSLRTPTPNTPTGALPGVDMRPQFGGAQFTSLADEPVKQTAAPFALEMQYGGLAPEAVQRVKQVDAGQGSLFDEAADEAESMIDEQLQLIEASPYFSVFHHFNPAGELKKVNPLTGKPLIVREGGKITQGRAEVWNIPGSGYDDVAAEAMAQVGGYNPRWAATAEEFWQNARDAFQQYKQLRKGTEIAPKSFMGDIAAGGGGGGGLGIVHPAIANMSEDVARMLVGTGGGGIVGGIGGGITGAGLGATQGFIGEDGDLGDKLGAAWEGAKGGAETGALLGAGAGMLGGGVIGRNTTAEAARHILRGGLDAALDTTGKVARPTSGLGHVKGLFSYWAGQITSHIRNLFNDDIYGQGVTSALVPGAQKYLKQIRTEVAQRQRQVDPFQRLSTPVQSLLGTFGKGTDYLPDIGITIAKDMEDEAAGVLASSAYSTILSGINPGGFAQNAAGLLLGGPVKGAAMPAWRRAFTAINHVMNRTFREGALVSEAGKFAKQGRQALIDAGYTGFKQFADDGMFTAKEVAQKLGTREAAVWQSVQDNALQLAEERVKFLFGDYSDAGKKAWEKRLGTAIPFASWAVRAYPVVLEMALEHPLIALGVYHATKALSQGAGKDGRPGYTAGMIPIPDKAGLLTGGQSGTAYLDPVGAISPVGGDMFASQDEGYDKSVYQDVQQGLQRLGLPGFNPVIQSLAYIMGMDFKGPSALSRTQGLENALGLLPGNPDLPDIGGGTLRAARGAVSPLVAGTDIGAALGATADPTPEQYDPITRRYDELVVDTTGKRLNDPSNKAYLIDLMYGRGELYERAEREALLGGAARNLASLSSPVGTVSQTDTARHAKQATSANPHTWSAVQATPQGTPARRAAEQARKAALAADPWIEPYSIGSQGEAEDILLREIAERYRTAGARLTPAGLAEQLRLMTERAERTRIR